MFFQDQKLPRYRPLYLEGWYIYSQECVEARRVWADQRWDAGVGACGLKPGSNASVWRSLDEAQHADVEPAERGQHDTKSDEERRDGRSGEVWRRRSS
jgi:hypothetical protein